FTKLFKSRFDWAFESEPQCRAGGRRVFVPRGKMLGGSANINGQIHQWCHPADFDGWASAGAPGRGWPEVAPRLRSQGRSLGADKERSRGCDGPMVVSPNRNARPLAHAFVEAARAAGLAGQRHYNGAAYEGAWICELAQLNGRRYSAYDAYLRPALRRANLEVLTDAQVTRVRLEGSRAV